MLVLERIWINKSAFFFSRKIKPERGKKEAGWSEKLHFLWKANSFTSFVNNKARSSALLEEKNSARQNVFCATILGWVLADWIGMDGEDTIIPSFGHDGAITFPFGAQSLAS